MGKLVFCVSSQECTKAYGTVDLVLGLLTSIFLATYSVYALLKINFEYGLYTRFKFTIEHWSNSESITLLLMICVVLGLVVYIGLSYHLISGAFLRSLDNCRFWYRFNLALVIVHLVSLIWSLYQNEQDVNVLLGKILWIAFRCVGLCIVRNFIREIETQEMFSKV